MNQRFLAAAVAAAGALLALPAAAPAASTSIVISEFQFRGADGNDEFIELRNISGQAVNVGNWELQGCAGASGAASNRTTIPAGTSVPAGRAYLIANSAGTLAGQADRTYGNGLADDGGARVLDAADAVVDGVGSVSGAVDNCREGAGLSIPTTNGTTRAFERKLDGTQDTDDNAADFDGPQARDPQNSGSDPSADPAPGVQGFSPAHNATGVAQNAPVDVTFSEPVTVDPAGFSLSCNPSGARPATVTPQSPTVVRVDPDQDLPRGETCTLTIAPGAVHDVDENDPPDAMANAATLRFTTIGLQLRIREIQGAAHISPYDDRAVLDVPGVVTAISGNGFWIQDTQPDADADTSEGIFVFMRNPRNNPLVVEGAPLKVSGTVDEFRPGGSGGLRNLTTTEIVRPTIAAGTAGGTVTVTRIGTGPGATLPPTEIIENEAGDVETPGFLFDPEQDGIDWHESHEGMLVSIQAPQVVGPTTGNEELAVLASGVGSPRTERGGILIRPDDPNPERIILDDAILLAAEPDLIMPPANVGDTLVGPVEAVVDYSFGNPKYLVTAVPEVNDNGLEREVTEPPRANQLAMASMNVENLAAVDPNLTPAQLEEKFQRLAAQLVTNLRSPDLVAVEEIQDNDGSTNSGNVDASETYERLITTIAAQGGPVYDYRQIDPQNNQDGGQRGGNIRVGFLFRTDRGLKFVDRPGGTATNETDVVATRKGARLTLSPGRLLDPESEGATTFEASRKPLVGEFLWKGRTVFAIANHFNSKGGDDPLFGHRQPPVQVTTVQRHQQAKVVAGFVEDVLEADPRAAIAVLGDLNDFEFSETLDIVEGAGLNNLMDTLPVEERYSYVFDGNSQVLDQILVSDELMTPEPEYDSVHVNAEFANQASDHDPQVARVVVRGTGNAGD